MPLFELIFKPFLFIVSTMVKRLSSAGLVPLEIFMPPPILFIIVLKSALPSFSPSTNPLMSLGSILLTMLSKISSPALGPFSPAVFLIAPCKSFLIVPNLLSSSPFAISSNPLFWQPFVLPLPFL